MKVCIIVSNFYPKISKMLIDGAVSKLKENKISNFQIITVPGTFEIPVVVSNLIDKYDAFVALGCVIKGQTSHFHYLCSSVINALTNLSIQSKKPIGNGILTCNNKKQAVKRADPSKKDKGGDAANAAISVFNIIK
jgi:6,7-dimethyl-8-ribityllumazine synthase|tara:strand:- start:613 stop:1020 length:408 start_codon:yes stop_codon:yes gene_type:complete